jgi:two-component system response regulator PilR (NtrC family)
MTQTTGERRPTIMVSDDEASLRELLAIVLENEGYATIPAGSGGEALETFRRNKRGIDLIIQDLKMPEVDGVRLLGHYTREAPDIPVVVITAFSTWDNAVEAMRLGAYDYIKKPFDTDTIRQVVNRAIERKTFLDACPDGLREEIASRPEMIGNHPSVQEVMQMVRRIAPTDSTVLIQGESGTGKELVARAVHYRSLRKGAPFVSVNCSAFTETLLESELFGHKKGAFTGAIADNDGFFQAASGGTLFLDEVADMSLTTQVKMLRVLEERRVTRVGSTESRPVDVRIIAATNKDILDEVRARRFREDLFYRLNVIPLWLTPLRERKDDIPLLAGYFLAKYARQMGKRVTGISAAARETLRQYDWPGNVRELENVIQRQVALCEGPTIERIQLIGRKLSRADERRLGAPLEIRIPEEGIDLEKHLADYERDYLREALRLTDGNLTNAARLLGMSYRSIRYRVKKLKVREEELV